MKKIFSILSVVSLFLLASCEKNVLSYQATDLDVTTKAQVRLVYDLPIVPSSTTHNITLLKYNDQLVSPVSTALGGIFPSTIARYHVLPIGANKVEAFKGAAKDQLVYSNTFNVQAGKWSAFVYDANQAPLMVQDPEEYETGHPWTDTVTYIRFVNLLYKADGVTPFGKVYLKGRRSATQPNINTYDYIDIAECDFKQSSGYIPYTLKRNDIAIWSGTENGLAFVLFDESGNLLKTFSSTNVLGDYSATGYSMTKGVNYILHLNGKMGTNYATQSVRLGQIAVN